MRVLVVEDEKKTREYLCKGLRENGFVVDGADEGETGLHLALSDDYDLVIVDVMLPRRDGWSIVREMRRLGSETPALFLTARDEIEDQVKGLELGGGGQERAGQRHGLYFALSTRRHCGPILTKLSACFQYFVSGNELCCRA